jgi:hypothetical protein
MLQIGRPSRRLSFLAVSCLLAASVFAQSPSLTTVSDTVYKADGSRATGTLLISWPAFTTSDGHAVAAGTTVVERSIQRRTCTDHSQCARGSYLHCCVSAYRRRSGVLECISVGKTRGGGEVG